MRKKRPVPRTEPDGMTGLGDTGSDEDEFPGDYPRLSREEIVGLGKELLQADTPIKRKESILMQLAHNGCWEALKPLEDYVRMPDRELWVFAELAFEECRGWFKKDPYGRAQDAQVFMGFDRDKPCPCGSDKLFKECHGTLPLGPPTWEGR
jgi:hypothetical protein